MELEQRLGELRRLWPDLEWEEAELLHYDHDVVLLDDSYVFRFACEDPEHEPLEQEVKLLRRLRETGLPVPDYTHVDGEYRVAGYPSIPGHSLTYEEFISLAEDQRLDLSGGVAAVLNALHGLPLGEAESLGIPQDDPWYAEVRGFLFDYIRIVRQGTLSTDELSYCDKVVREIMAADLSSEILRSVIHADIEPPHILVDGGRFAGVIDFGDVVIGDPACDFGWLWELGEAFIDEVLSSYCFNTDDLKQRGHWFWFGRAMRELEWGARSRQRENWERGYRFFPEGVASPERATGVW